MGDSRDISLDVLLCVCRNQYISRSAWWYKCGGNHVEYRKMLTKWIVFSSAGDTGRFSRPLPYAVLLFVQVQVQVQTALVPGTTVWAQPKRQANFHPSVSSQFNGSNWYGTPTDPWSKCSTGLMRGKIISRQKHWINKEQDRPTLVRHFNLKQRSSQQRYEIWSAGWWRDTC